MPNFSQGFFNIGTDRTIQVIQNSTNQPINLGGRITDIEATSKMTTITSNPIDNQGYAQHRYSYEGWTGTITIDRANGFSDALQAFQEANYHQGGQQNYFTILETTNNPNGTQDSFQYNYCVIKLPTTGQSRRDQTISLRLEFDAQERVNLNNNLAA